MSTQVGGTRISVIGLGRLGSPMAAVFASKGFPVIGVDIDPKKVDAINSQRAPVNETGLDELIKAHGEYLTATTSIRDAVLGSDMTFIVAATPSRDDGEFSLEYILPICDEIGKTLKNKQWHVVVITSTVMPGDTDGPIKRTLEFASEKKCGPDFGLVYNPEFIALGSVIHDFQNPDMVLIGKSGVTDADWFLGQIYNQVCDNKFQICAMSAVNAELTKLSINTYVTTKISYANALARLCERIPGADIDVITEAVGSDSRIGHKYLKGAVSYGGPCFPRDNVALAALANRVDSPFKIAEVVHEFNQDQVQWMAQCLETKSDRWVAVLGLTYKLGTDIRIEAFGSLLLQELKQRGRKSLGYDPVLHNDPEILRYYLSVADIVVIALPCEEFKALTLEDWQAGEEKTVIDCWRMFKHLDGVKGINYVALGVGSIKEKSCSQYF